jgi:hypothetical protein
MWGDVLAAIGGSATAIDCSYRLQPSTAAIDCSHRLQPSTRASEPKAVDMHELYELSDMSFRAAKRYKS